MSRPKILLRPLQKQALYAVTAALWLTGVLWWVLASSDTNRPLWMKIHGAAAMIFLMVFGTLLLDHLPAGWQRNRQRPSGTFVTTLCAILVMTGWGLYYVGDDAFRRGISLAHLVLGLALPLLIFIHLHLGRREERRDNHARMGSKTE